VFTKTCLVCEKEFQTKAHNTRYCSGECRLEVTRRRNQSSQGPAKIFNRTCEHCGTPFETKVANKKYCSEECYRLATAAKKRVKRGKMRGIKGQLSEDVFLGLCSVCGEDSVPVRECPECGFFSCEKCRDQSGLCNICSGVLKVPAI
jgi:ribosomal protein L32